MLYWLEQREPIAWGEARDALLVYSDSKRNVFAQLLFLVQLMKYFSYLFPVHMSDDSACIDKCKVNNSHVNLPPIFLL